MVAAIERKEMKKRLEMILDFISDNYKGQDEILEKFLKITGICVFFRDKEKFKEEYVKDDLINFDHLTKDICKNLTTKIPINADDLICSSRFTGLMRDKFFSMDDYKTFIGEGGLDLKTLKSLLVFVREEYFEALEQYYEFQLWLEGNKDELGDPDFDPSYFFLEVADIGLVSIGIYFMANINNDKNSIREKTPILLKSLLNKEIEGTSEKESLRFLREILRLNPESCNYPNLTRLNMTEEDLDEKLKDRETNFIKMEFVNDILIDVISRGNYWELITALELKLKAANVSVEDILNRIKEIINKLKEEENRDKFQNLLLCIVIYTDIIFSLEGVFEDYVSQKLQFNLYKRILYKC